MDESATRIGPEIPNIDIIDVIGSGGMSTVFKARHRLMDQTVAVKIILESAIGELGLTRFLREAKHTAALDHPNVVKILSSGELSSGEAYIVMEYIQGKSLADLLKRQGRLHREQLKSIFEALCSALDYAHKSGLLHRDIKPANVMLQLQNDDSASIATVKLLDFGIAKSINKEDSLKLTESGFLVGTPNYMSPEQCRDQKLDQRSDLYSLACVLYECLVGEKLFTGDTALEVMYKHLQEEAPLDARFTEHYGAGLTRFLRRALSKDPEGRFNDANAFKGALMPELEEMQTQTLQMNTNKAAKPGTKSLILVAVLSVLFGGALGGGVATTFQQKMGNSKSNQANLVNVQSDRKGLKDYQDSMDLLELKTEARSAFELGMKWRDVNPKRARRYFIRVDELATSALRKVWKEQFELDLMLGLSRDELYEFKLDNEDVRHNWLATGEGQLLEARNAAYKIWSEKHESKDFGTAVSRWSKVRYKLNQKEDAIRELKTVIAQLRKENPGGCDSLLVLESTLKELEADMKKKAAR